MTKTFLALTILGVFLVGGSAAAADGTINFTGNIEAATCTISPGAGATGHGKTIAVAMDTYASTAFTGAGQSLGKKDFAIALSGAGCVASKTYSMEFSGGNVDATTGHLNIATGLGNATGLQLRMLNKTGAVVNLSTQANAPSVITTADGKGLLEMGVEYYSTLAAVTDGSVTSSVEFVLKHN